MFETDVQKERFDAIVTVEHDAGRCRIEVVARNEEAAIAMVMAAEGCPRCAIIQVESQ